MFHSTTIFKGIVPFIFFVFIGNTSLKGQTTEIKHSSQLPNKEEKKDFAGATITNTQNTFRVSNIDAPKGNSIEARIARAEFYKAQYSHEPETQAKYQQTIEQLKKEQLINSNLPKD